LNFNVFEKLYTQFLYVLQWFYLLLMFFKLNRFRLNSDHSSNIPNLGVNTEDEERLKKNSGKCNNNLQSFLPPDQVDLAEEISSTLKDMQFEIAMINSEMLKLLT